MQVKLFERLVFRFLLEDLLNSLNLSVFVVSEESKLELKKFGNSNLKWNAWEQLLG